MDFDGINWSMNQSILWLRAQFVVDRRASFRSWIKLERLDLVWDNGHSNRFVSYRRSNGLCVSIVSNIPIRERNFRSTPRRKKWESVLCYQCARKLARTKSRRSIPRRKQLLDIKFSVSYLLGRMGQTVIESDKSRRERTNSSSAKTRLAIVSCSWQ